MLGMYDISFPVGTTYVLIIDTDQYAGNFEREMCGFLTGTYDEDRSHGCYDANRTKEEFPEFVERFVKKKTTLAHDEYGEVGNTIATTKEAPLIYNSVAIFFEKELTALEMDFIRVRAPKFRDNINVLNVYQMKREVSSVDTIL